MYSAVSDTRHRSERGNIPCSLPLHRCIHKAGLVWTDLKLDNMVLCGKEVRAIDLEAAVPARSPPKSFTPEATPPDFVVATRNGVSA